MIIEISHAFQLSDFTLITSLIFPYTCSLYVLAVITKPIFTYEFTLTPPLAHRDIINFKRTLTDFIT